MGTTCLPRRGFLLRLGCTAIGAFGARDACAQEGGKQKPRVLFFSRSGRIEHPVVHRDGDELSVGEQLMIEMGRTIGADVECTKDGGVFDRDLDRFDAFVQYGNYDPTQPNQRGDPPVTALGKTRLIEAVASGKGLFGIHCASYAFLSGPGEQWQPPEQRDPYVKMLGGELCGANGKQNCRHRIVSPKFPGVDRLKTPVLALADEPYGLKNFADDIHVIAVQETKGLSGKIFNRPPFPSIWARRHDRGRVLYVEMGHDEEAWRSEPFRNIVLGGLDWVLGRVEADIPPNLKKTAPEAHKMP
jgi:type 1 glutamine amidotransferase